MKPIRTRDELPSFSTPESDELDWKRSVNIECKCAREEIAKDIAAMANQSGGHIIIGIKEAKDGKQPEIHSMNFEQAHKLKNTYEHVAMELISPPPTSIIATPIELDKEGSGKWILVVYIEKSKSMFCGIKTKAREGQVIAWRITRRVASQARDINPEEAQSRIVEAVRKTTESALDIQLQIQSEASRKAVINEFEEFMRYQNMRDILISGLGKDGVTEGLLYSIQPVRIEGTPVFWRMETRIYWLVKVLGPTNVETLNETELAQYEDSPICDGEYYYCTFENSSWRLSKEVFSDYYPFKFQGNTWTVGRTENANSYVRRVVGITPSENTKHLDLMIDQEGNLLSSPKPAGTSLVVYGDKSGKLFLRINDSPLKQIYFTDIDEQLFWTDWRFTIDNMRGHGNPRVRKAILDLIHEQLIQKNVPIPKISTPSPYSHDPE